MLPLHLPDIHLTIHRLSLISERPLNSLRIMKSTISAPAQAIIIDTPICFFQPLSKGNAANILMLTASFSHSKISFLKWIRIILWDMPRASFLILRHSRIFSTLAPIPYSFLGNAPFFRSFFCSHISHFTLPLFFHCSVEIA